MIENKYKLGQEVRVWHEGGFKNGVITSIALTDEKVVYEIKLTILIHRSYALIKKTEFVKRFEKEIRKPKHMSDENKIYGPIEIEKKVKEIFGEEGIANIRLLQIIIEDEKVEVHYTLKGEFEPRVSISKCHPEDTFDENKGIMACIIKSNIEALKMHLRKI